MYVILTQNPIFFPGLRVKMTYPPHHPAKLEKKNLTKKKIMKFQFGFFVKNFDEIFFSRLAGWCGGVCHFDTKPQNFPEAPCQNDIPTFMIGYHNSDM